MGSRVQKIAFLIFALMFVAIMAILNTSILTLGTSANGQLTSIVTSDDAALNIYDNQKVYGSTAASCAKDPSAVAETVENVYVITAADTTGQKYTSESGESYPISSLSDDEKTAKTINSTAKFNSYLCINSNGVITGVLFVQDGASTANASSLVTETTIQGL